MKGLTPREVGVLILSAFLIMAGQICLGWPREMILSQATNNEVGWQGGFTEVVGKVGRRFYGAAAIIVGVGLECLVACRKQPSNSKESASPVK